MKSNNPDSVKLEPTGHRQPPGPDAPEQRTKSFPHEDAATNQTYIALGKPAGTKPLGKTLGLSLNDPCQHAFDHSLVQRARRGK